MNIKQLKEKIITWLPADELAFGEILFNNCDCQILSQSSVSIDFLVNVSGEKEFVEYSLLIDNNLITRNSIEQQIAAGLLVKQSLFEGVLDSESRTNYVDFSSKGRSQFIEQLEAFINRMESEDITSDTILEETVEQEKGLIETFEPEYFEDEDNTDTPQLSIPFEDQNTNKPKESSEEQKITSVGIESKAAELEQVMNNGMQFLAGMFKMATGKELGMEGQQIKVNKETGEVTMTFKLPM